METENFLKEYQYALDLRLSEIHKAQLKQSKEKGEEDGRRNLPSVDDDFTTPVEQEIRNKYQAEIESLFQNGRQVIDELQEKDFKSVNQELNDLNEKKINDLLGAAETERNRKLKELTTNHLDNTKDIENSPHYQLGKKRFENIRERWEHVTASHNRQELNIQFKPYWAYILLGHSHGFC